MTTPAIRGSANFERPSPVVLSSGCTIVNGTTNVPQYSDLAYPYRKAVVVDEIRFDLFADATGMDAGQPPNLGALVYVKLQLGQHYLMRDYVPIWLLGTKMDSNEEENLDDSLATANNYSHYRWKLPEPLYVEAGQVLQCTFSRAVPTLTGMPATVDADITAQVTYAGRVVGPNTPRPGVLAVPYVAPFVTTWGQVYQQSNEYHLFNALGKTLRIQRMTGRVLQSIAGGEGNVINEIQVLTPVTAGAVLTVQINDSWGGKIVNDRTGPADIWDAPRGAWTFDTVMPEKGQYELRVWNIPADQQLHVAMVGVREEAI